MTEVTTSSPPIPATADVVVIGAGLAGLAAAYAVQRAGRDVVVLESSDDVGGRVRTDIVDGYRLDRGFQILLTAYPELQTEVDLDALDLRSFEPGAMVWDGRRMEVLGDPLRRPGTLVQSGLAKAATFGDKARLLTERLRLRSASAPDLLRQDDIATRDALRSRGFSERIIDRFFVPFLGGIQLDPSLGTSQRMLDVILQSLFSGDAAVPAAGMGALPAQLAGRLAPGTVHFGARVAKVAPGGVVLDDTRQLAAERVVVATEGPAAAALLGLEPVASNPAGCVWFAADRPPHADRYLVVDGTGAAAARTKTPSDPMLDRPAMNIAVMTNVAPSYAPDGSALIAAACPGRADPEIEPAVRAQLRSIWGSQVDSWRTLRTDVIPHGQPRQHPPFAPKQRVDLGEGLFVCGDHRDTASLQGAMFSGRRCGEAVVASLG